MKASTEASLLADRTWLLLAKASADGAAAGGAEAKKLVDSCRVDISRDPGRGALLILQQVMLFDLGSPLSVLENPSAG